jgi:phage anti-repressor protein
MTDFTPDLAFSLFKAQSSEDYPVNFEDAFPWLGYSRKDHAKRSFLACGFIEGVDFRILKIRETRPDGSFSHYWEYIRMTVDCFKTWGMMAGTQKGKEVRRYFLDCEKIAAQQRKKPSEADIKAHVDAVLKQLLDEQIPEKATTWQCRYTKRFWGALENLYGLKQGQPACARVINAYIYDYFPKEVRQKLDKINPLLENGTRANRQHQHFDDTLLELLKVQISQVTWLLEASADKKAFIKSMKKVKKLSFNIDTTKLLKGE